MNDPIHVDQLPPELLGLPGRLGMTFAPGQQLYSFRRRDLRADLGHLAHGYGTRLLVSLVEDADLVRLNIASLVDVAKTLGIDVVRFPIVDGRVPASVAATRTVVEQALTACAENKNVVIHCRAGLGRTGLLAACCLVARGLDAESAIVAVRSTRPGTVETEEQETFVRQFELGRRYA